MAKQRKTFQFNCTRYNGELLAVKNDPFIEEFSPKILRTDINEIEPILYDYLQKDGVPRVKTKVGIIVNNKEAIFE